MRAQHGVGARRRDETCQLRSAPCRLNQSNKSFLPYSARATPHSHPQTHGGLWICGQRKGVAHISTGPTAAASTFNLMNSKSVSQTCLRYPGIATLIKLHVMQVCETR